MILASSYDTLSILLPSLCTVIVACIGGYVSWSTHQRGSEVGALSEAYDQQDKLVGALKGRVELLEAQEEECQLRVEKMQKDHARLRRELTALKRRLK